MYFRITDDLKQPLESAVRRKRLVSSLIYYPIIVLIGAALVMLFLFTRGHGIVWALRNILGDRFSDKEIVTGLAIVVLAASAVVVVLLLRSIFRERIYEEHLFCRACAAVDKDDVGSCPLCGGPLTERHTFFITHFDDETQLAERFGLTATNEDS